MIKGIGIDLLEVDRIQKAIQKEGFLDRYFTKKEQEMFHQHQMNPQKIAGNFSTKEAVVKMFGTGFREIRLIDIEVLRDELGKPVVTLNNEGEALRIQLEIDHIWVSISNTKGYVTAVAVGEKL